MKNITGTIILSVATLLATTTSAKADCGIECWLSNTFSSRDWVGDWLRDNLGGIHNSGDEENGELVMSTRRPAALFPLGNLVIAWLIKKIETLNQSAQLKSYFLLSMKSKNQKLF